LRYLTHVSNLVGSSSDRQCYLQYGMLYMHRCVQSSGQERVSRSPAHQTVHTAACKTCRIAYTTVSLKRNPRGSKHV